MYDNVNYKCDCPYCGAKLYRFQSKDGDCLLDDLEPEDVYNFYTSCKVCRKWVEFAVVDIEPLEVELLKSKSYEIKRKPFMLNGRAILNNIFPIEELFDYREKPITDDFNKLKAVILTQKHGIDLTPNGYSEKFDCWFSEDEYKEI